MKKLAALFLSLCVLLALAAPASASGQLLGGAVSSSRTVVTEQQTVIPAAPALLAVPAADPCVGAAPAGLFVQRQAFAPAYGVGGCGVGAAFAPAYGVHAGFAPAYGVRAGFGAFPHAGFVGGRAFVGRGVGFGVGGHGLAGRGLFRGRFRARF